MKRTAVAIAAALALGVPTAFAGGGDFQDYARVRDVQPEYERVNVPRQECYTETESVPQTYNRRGNSVVGSLIGGVAGGLIGSRVGQGNGRVAAAAAGAAVGALVGNHLGSRDDGYTRYEQRDVQRCRTVDNWESRVTGYHVSYDYQGRSYTTFLPYDPGDRLAVRVNVEPAR